MYKLSQFLYSAKLGDGCFYRRKERHTCLLQFTSYNKEYIDFMYKEFDKLGYFPQSVKKIHSGFKEGSEGYYFHTRVHEDFNYVKSLSVKETISMLDKNGLIFYYLDDGSYHKNRHFGHIYCNTFTVDEVNCLIDKIYELYPIKKCTIRWDKKQDGRKYPYIYIPVSVMNVFKNDIKDVLDNCGLKSFYYKIGLPSQTTEKQ